MANVPVPEILRFEYRQLGRQKTSKIFSSGREKGINNQAGFEPMTTAPPALAIVCSATQLNAARHRFSPPLYTLPL